MELLNSTWRRFIRLFTLRCSTVVVEVEEAEKQEEYRSLAEVPHTHGDGVSAIVDRVPQRLCKHEAKLYDLEYREVLLPPEIRLHARESRQEVVGIHDDVNGRVQERNVEKAGCPSRSNICVEGRHYNDVMIDVEERYVRLLFGENEEHRVEEIAHTHAKVQLTDRVQHFPVAFVVHRRRRVCWGVASEREVAGPTMPDGNIDEVHHEPEVRGHLTEVEDTRSCFQFVRFTIGHPLGPGHENEPQVEQSDADDN